MLMLAAAGGKAPTIKTKVIHHVLDAASVQGCVVGVCRASNTQQHPCVSMSRLQGSDGSWNHLQLRPYSVSSSSGLQHHLQTFNPGLVHSGPSGDHRCCWKHTQCRVGNINRS